MNMSYSLNQGHILENYEIQESKFLTPFQKRALLKCWQSNLQPEYRRRIEIMLLADIGKSQSQICEILGCSQEMARYWIGLAQAGLAHKWNERPIGRPKIVNDQYLARLRELVSHSPRDYGYAFTYWTAQWLSKHLANEFNIQISDRHINRLLKQMGLSTKGKSSSPCKTYPNPSQDSRITICDLQSTSESNFQSSLNLMSANK